MCLPLLAAPLIAATGSTVTGAVVSAGLLQGMTVAAVGMTSLTTLMSGGMAVFQQQTQKRMIEGQNKQAADRFQRQQQIANADLTNKYESINSRELVENRIAAQEKFVRDRQMEASKSKMGTQAAIAGVQMSSPSLQALEQAITFNWGMSDTNVNYGLVTSSRQYQQMAKGYRAESLGRQEAAMPKYKKPPSLIGPLLTTAGAGISNLTTFGGKDWLQGLGKKTPKAPGPIKLSGGKGFQPLA